MMTNIADETRIGTVALFVSDLSRSLAFYQEHLGFRILAQQRDEATLGVENEALLHLREKPGARAVRGVSGLYHFAILMPNRLELARILRNFAEKETPMQGFSDHKVSEALYLADPDRNGIEVYRDRPRSEWPYNDGKLMMATDPLDLEDILSELPPDDGAWNGLPAGTTIGHIHLHVSNLEREENFYRVVLGFDLVTRYPPSASFLSAGGYHHHIGINVWAGNGAPPPPPDAVGLRWYTIDLPSKEAREDVEQRVRSAGVEIEAHEEGHFLRDPAGNGIVLRVTP